MRGYFRANIEKMKGYTPGFQPKGSGWIKLNTNENPYPPSPKAVDAIAGACRELRKYPDPLGDGFRVAAADALDVKPEQIICGNGSDDILTIIVRSFCGQGDTMAYPYPSYSLYPVLAQIQGCKSVAVEFPKDYSLPLGLLETDAKLIFLCNPNAPTGTFVAVDDIAALACSFDGMLVVDEAYVDFADDNALRLVRRHHNVIVVRSLSKSYSLAGLRFGFAVADEKVIEGMMKVKDSYNVDRLALAAATAAIEDQDWMKNNVERIKRTRTSLVSRLRHLGFSVLNSKANFVLARCESREAAKRIFAGLKRRRILVRYFALPGVDDCIRITVGTDEEIDAFISMVKQIL